jgi:voltage-gated potassium channel
LSFFGIIDLLAILPFYLSTGLDLRSLRALRLLRIFKFFRYSKTLKRVSTALAIAKQELILFFSLTCILLYLSAVGIYHFENPVQPEVFTSIFDSLWWSVATLTTVGYGDLYPITVGGKVFTFLILMIGLGIVSIPAGIIASAVSKAREEE